MKNSKKRRKGTSTSSFGVSKRENHDSSRFYNRSLYKSLEIKETKNIDYIETPLPPNLKNKIVKHDSRDLSFIPDSSIHLVITSPPYNTAKEYDKDMTLEEYRKLIRDVFKEIYPKMVNGGRVCINVANVGRKPYLPLHAYITLDLIKLGYLMRGEIIWNKGASAGISTAWGSWKSASNPTLRDIHEYILIFSKGTFSRKKKSKEDTISKEEFLEYTKSIWTFSAESAKKIGHPAPFPDELPYRLIQLYSFEGDVILDPFCGSGTTCVAAYKTKRYFIGVDIEQKYVELARKRINKETVGRKNNKL